MNQGATPSASGAPGRVVSVSWGASTLSNGHAVAGYVVRRYDAGSGVVQTILPGCAGTISGTSCSESDVPTGQWQYTVTPAIATNWQGQESVKSGAVTVAAATLTLNTTTFGAPLPQTTSGSLTGFAANEGVTYRLDAGTALTGSPSSVGSAGAATISALTIPGASDGPHTVYAIGSASPNASQASVGIVVDTIAPTVSAQLSPAPNASGWNNTTPVSVTLSASDGTGSGIKKVGYTTDGSDPTTSATTQLYTAPVLLSATTTFKYFATDNAGNTSAVQTQLVKVDTTPPVNAIALSSVTGGAFRAGATIYYRASSAGSLKLSNGLADTGGSGPASTAYAALAGASTGWSFTSSSATTGPPYVSNVFSWTAGTSSSPTETATGADIAGNTTTTALTFASDTLGPTGGALTVNGVAASGAGSSSSSATTAFTLGPRTDYSTDAGSGLASSVLSVQSFVLSANVCGAAAGPFSTPTTVNGTTQPGTVLSAFCYVYTLTGNDNVGNTSVVSTTVKVSSTPPTITSLTTTNTSGGTTGQLDLGDRITVTFSKQLKASTICSAWSDNTGTIQSQATFTLSVNIANPNLLSVTSAPAGCGTLHLLTAAGLTLGSPDYIQNGTVTITNTTIAYDDTNHQITITLGTITPLTNAQQGAVPNSALTLNLATTITDLTGSAVTNTPLTTTNIRQF